MKLMLKGGVVGGLVLFIWSALSWMALPIHEQTFHGFSNETLVESALMASLDKGQAGVYILPNPKGPANQTEDAQKQAMEKSHKGPFAFIVMTPKGWGSMGLHMLVGFLINFLSAALVTGLLLKTGGMKYWGRVWFVVLFAVTAGVICHLPEWNWWGFSARFIGAQFLDLIAGWLLAGLAIARITK
jgi:hypothetical protein